MFMSEIDSFICKFRNLLHSGRNARLEIKSESGKATVNLSAEVEIPAKQSYQPRNIPARQRRRDRRAAARAEAVDTEAAADAATEDVAAAQVEKDVEARAAIASDVTIGNKFKDAVEATDLEAGTAFEPADEMTKEAEIDFSCHICDFSSNWESGLHIHMTKKHANIEQVDGNETLDDDLEEDAQYKETSHYWKTGRLGTSYQAFIDANDCIEKSNLPEEIKKRETTKILDARKCAFGPNFERRTF